jgi:hypothetical protein
MTLPGIGGRNLPSWLLAAAGWPSTDDCLSWRYRRRYAVWFASICLWAISGR